MKKILGRVIVILPAIALQVLWFYLAFYYLDSFFDFHLGKFLQVLFTVLSVIFVINIAAKRDESTYKQLWIIVIAALPVFGAFLYFTVGDKKTGLGLKKKLEASRAALAMDKNSASDANLAEIEKENPRLAQTLGRVSEATEFSILKNDTSRYYSFGEHMFADMCEDLKKAEDYIYVEYFIIQAGQFWDTMVDIMAERAAAGVDVRVIYDDLGSISTYSPEDIAVLKKKGIKCISFNPIFLIKSQLNNRDHRKIMVIDGKIAYSGGVNLADEYINVIERFGRWKDIGFRITGEGVISYTYFFIEFWNAFSKDKISKVSMTRSIGRSITEQQNGFILPYYDSPTRNEHTSNELFTEILSIATDYVWFYTPYLILGDALFDAFIRAARRGVDVRIIMPGIPDKKMVFALSRSYYEELMKSGVKIYEYTPGFVHAKAMIADDQLAGIGTVNLDYRSLFLHFECNSIFYKADIIDDLKKDMLSTMEECKKVEKEDVQKGMFYKFGINVLKLFAPLM